ncbi:MAG: hypothetical protein Hals2KO_37240 [Halioglobus sp.]|jgi:hypothetical protein
MSDDINDTEGDYEFIARGEKAVEEDGNQLPVPLPPDHVMKSAFLTAIKYRTVESALVAYHRCINEMASIKGAQARYKNAELQEERAVLLLRDSAKIHYADAADRSAVKNAAEQRLMQSEEHLKQAEHQATLDDLRREMELKNAKDQHAAFIAGNTAGTDELSEEEQELKEFLESRVNRSGMAKKVAAAIRQERDLSGEETAILDSLVNEISTTSEG